MSFQMISCDYEEKGLPIQKLLILNQRPLVSAPPRQKAAVHIESPRTKWDNALAESFFKTLKAEWVYIAEPTTIAEKKVGVFEFIEVWYNWKRMHASLGYLTPVKYEAKLHQNQYRNIA